MSCEVCVAKSIEADLEFKPATKERWKDVEELFGARGACGGCWCMSWRLPRATFNRQKGAGNRSALRDIIFRGTEPGILAYHRREPVGWCALAPRQDYPALGRSRILAPVDAEPVWSVSCLFVAKRYRNQGVSTALLKAAVRFARERGAKIIEGYPQDLGGARLPDAFVWTGISQSFVKAGFEESARRSPKRPIMRKAQ
jgi:GNAT superfamily N-acetyltransferase